MRTQYGNQTYLLAGLFAYNLIRELQMQTTGPSRHTTAKRASLWGFEGIDTLGKALIQRAGRLTRPERHPNPHHKCEPLDQKSLVADAGIDSTQLVNA